VYRRQKLTEEEILRLENEDRREALVVKMILKIVKSWYTYASVLLAAAFAELTNLINWIN